LITKEKEKFVNIRNCFRIEIRFFFFLGIKGNAQSSILGGGNEDGFVEISSVGVASSAGRK
jgi:hypothetical protein